MKMNRLIKLLSRSVLVALAAIALLALSFNDAAAAGTASTNPLAWGSNSAGQLGYANPTSDLSPDLVIGLGPGTGVVAIAAGNTHSLALKSDGTVLVWGGNSNGQVGDGTTTTRVTPLQVIDPLSSGLLRGVVAIAAGNAHSLALKSDGTVWAWGNNANGQLGDGTTTQRTTPVQVSGAGSGVVAIAAGNAHSLALKSDGTVLAWGTNVNGQLGDGTTTQRTTPVQVSGLGPGGGVVAIAAGFTHSLAVKSDGTVLAWGANNAGQLGDGTTTQRTTPVQVSGLGLGSGVVAIVAGQGYSLAVKSDGTVLAWGGNGSGGLGDGTITQRTTPVQPSGLGPGSGVVAIATGTAAGGHSLALKSDGTVLAWGNNANGNLGDGNIHAKLEPLSVAALGGIVAIAGGGQFSSALSVDGSVPAWGANGNGQLGDGTITTRVTPLQAIDPLSPSGLLRGVVAIAVGNAYSLALKSDGAVLAWGFNSTGNLGDGTIINRIAPIQVSGFGSGSGAVAIAAGANHGLALKSDGTLWTWGNNATGQLGDGTTTQRNTPIQVSGFEPGSGVVAIAAGTGYSLAVKSDGTVLAWGNNANGQLGDGTTAQSTAPIQVSGLGLGSGVVAISAGNAHNLALKSNGTVLAWGLNATGQLGDGTTTQRTTPVQVFGLGPGSGVVAITAANGGLHSLALKSDGTVLAWGSNAAGQLGDGTLETKLVPVRVSGLGSGSGVVAIAAGNAHSLALPALTISSGVFYFAQAGGGGGFSTAILLANPSRTKSISGSVSFFGARGRPLEGVVDNAVESFVLPPSATATLSTRSQGGVTSGYARLSSSDPVVAIATYSIPGLPSLAVGPSTAPAFAFRAPASRDRLRGIDVGVAAVNVSDTQTWVSLSLIDSGGNEFLSSVVFLAPGEQLSRFLSELIPNVPNKFLGTLQIRVLPNPFQPQAGLAATLVEFGPDQLREVPLTVVR